MYKNPKIMGILNITEDSYYDGGRYISFEKAIAKALQMENEGADIIDIGGESTRPYSKEVPLNEEKKRVIPVIKILAKELSIPISIDSRKPEVTREALEAGASIVNDIAGATNPLMRKLVKEYNATYCIMHMQGSPDMMQVNPHYENGVITEILDFFKQQTTICLEEGIKESQLLLDPGIGFGKTVDDNIVILQDLEKLSLLGFPLLFGCSRKSFLQKILNKDAEEVLAATLAANTLALVSGVNIIRVHDVKPHRDIVDFLVYKDKIKEKRCTFH